jgi:hypothetical protein
MSMVRKEKQCTLLRVAMLFKQIDWQPESANRRFFSAENGIII